jgi:hypothetical protein
MTETISNFIGLTSDKPLFLVSSIIHPPNIPTGNLKRSIFSDDERLEQTIKTCKSIINQFEDANILLLELSELTSEEIERLSPHVTKIILYHEHSLTKEYSSRSNRSAGELFSLREIVKLLDENSCSMLYKLSGRYELSDMFKTKNYSNEKITFRKGTFGLFPRQKKTKIPSPNDTYYYTVLYSVPNHLIRKYGEFLEKSWKKLNKKDQDMEHIFFQMFDKNFVRTVSNLGCYGNLSVCGGFIFL